MTGAHPTDAALIRAMQEQIVDAALLKFNQQHRDKPKMDIPPPLKWAGAIMAALMTGGVGWLAFWLVSTLSALQLTVARMDERQQLQVTVQYQALEQRVIRLEELQRKEAAQ